MKTSCETRVSRMGLGSFVDINIFVMKYCFFSFVTFSIFFESLKSKSTQMLKPPKRKLGSFVQRYCLNFGLRSAVNYSQQGCRVHRTDDLELVFFCLNGKKLRYFYH